MRLLLIHAGSPQLQRHFLPTSRHQSSSEQAHDDQGNVCVAERSAWPAPPTFILPSLPHSSSHHPARGAEAAPFGLGAEKVSWMNKVLPQLRSRTSQVAPLLSVEGQRG